MVSSHLLSKSKRKPAKEVYLSKIEAGKVTPETLIKGFLRRYLSLLRSFVFFSILKLLLST